MKSQLFKLVTWSGRPLSNKKRCLIKWTVKRRFSFDDSEIEEIKFQSSQRIEVRSLEADLMFSLKKNLAILTKVNNVCLAMFSSLRFDAIVFSNDFECLEMCRNKIGSNDVARSSDKMFRMKSSLEELFRLRIAS